MTLSTPPATALANSLGSAAPQAIATPAGSAPEAEQRFLKLLVTQLNNQDPLNPLDNAQLTSQLAQMSTVSGIEKLNSAFASLVAQSSAGQVLQSASLIGRQVLVPGQSVALTNGAPAPYGVDLPRGADTVQINISNAQGQLVRSIDAGALPAGLNTLTWDGLDNARAALPAGAYTISAVAQQGDSSAAVNVLTAQRVSSVAQSGNLVSLELASGARASLADVRRIQ